MYADERHIYVTFCSLSVVGSATVTQRINDCVTDIHARLTCNLQINDSMTEALIVCLLYLKSKVTISHLDVG